MKSTMEIKEMVQEPGTPNVPGLTFRKFCGEQDYLLMLSVINATKDVDKVERSDTVEDIRRGYSHLERSDPYEDMLFAEVDGEVVGYSRGWWDAELNGDHLYSYFVFLDPAWRGKGIGKAMSRWMQARLQEIAQEHPSEAPKYLQTSYENTEIWNAELYTRDGFKPVRYAFSMTRPCSEPMEALPLPKGVELRPAKPEHYRPIWEADQEAFKDHWGYVAGTEENYKEWLEHPTFQPDLWKVAWDGDQVVGMVLNFIHEQENEEYQRKRGYTENISVRRPWRRKGVARALLTQSIKMFQDMSMEETALGVDTENPNGALNLYQSVGYKEKKRWTTLRKPLK